MAQVERVVSQENKSNWKTAALFWGGAIVAIAYGATVAGAVGVVLMGAGTWAWWKGRGKG